jgi:hypothetical protein
LTRDRSTQSWGSSPLALGIVGTVIAALLIVFAAHAIHVAPAPERGSRVATHADARGPVGLSALLGGGDGQAYAAIARDPSLARPELLAGKAEYAYRAQRPLFGELGWVVSLGRPHRVPLALAILSAISAGLAVAALALLLQRRGIPGGYALAIFVVPAALGIVWGMTPEILEVALITTGILAWTARPKRLVGVAVIAFTLAALTRESMLLVPVALAWLEVWRKPERSTVRALRPLIIPFVAYVAWISFVRVRLGVWPFEARSQRLTLVPFAGLVHSVQHSSDQWTAVAWVVIGLLVVVSALWWGRHDELYAVVVAFLVMAPFLGADVWRRPADFGRVLFPLIVYSAVLVLDALWHRSHSEQEPFVTLRHAS